MGEPSALDKSIDKEEEQESGTDRKLLKLKLNERSSSKIQFRGLLGRHAPQEPESRERLLPLLPAPSERQGPIFDSQSFAPSPKNPASLINSAEVYATFR